MAKVQISNVEVLDNPSAFFNPFQFQITFDCIENLSDGKLTDNVLYCLRSFHNLYVNPMF